MIKLNSLAGLNLLHGMSEKEDGNIDPRFSSQRLVTRNLTRIAKKIGISPSAIAQMQQVHQTNIARVGEEQQGKVIAGVDGLISNEPGTFLLLRLADCIPVVLFDLKNPAVGLVHSGWRGAVGKILLAGIESMMLEFNSNPKDLLVVLGPSIKACCNLCKEPPIQLQLPEWKPFIKERSEGVSLDLTAFVVRTALKAGVRRENIKVSNICTVMQESLFSNQRSKISGEPQGRFAFIVGLKS